MKRKWRNRAALMLCAAMTVPMTGCVQSLDFGSVDEDLVVEYAVNAVINHDKNYIVKLADRTVEAETTVWVGDDNGEEETTASEETEVVSVDDQLTEAFSLSGIKIEFSGIDVADKYPDDNDGFSMVATSGKKLLVVKLRLKNTTANAVSLNMLEASYKIKCILGDSTVLNAQVTALLDGFNTWKGSIASSKSEDVVLVFQIDEAQAANTGNITLAVSNGSETKKIALSE